MNCRICGACCIACSISSSIPGMPDGKPAGVRCLQLSEQNRCALYGQPNRPQVCSRFQASEDVCGASYAEAVRLLTELELLTRSAIPN